jgi:glucokinase
MSAAPPRLLLAADVGGTKTLLQLRRLEPAAPPPGLPVAEQRYRSDAFDSLEAMVQHFLDESGHGTPQSACFAVAGPLQQEGPEQRAQLTNLPWQLATQQMRRTLAIPRITLLNDFQAIGYSLDLLDETMLAPLTEVPVPAGGARLVVGAGTGLGVCLVFPHDGQSRSYPSEGGHLAFAPRNPQETALLAYLQRDYERVSYERLVSGQGLVNIYRFLLHQHQQLADSLLEAEDAAAAIGEHGLAQPHTLAGEALSLFAGIYGAFSGDMALACLPSGGVYIAGGIAPKLLPRLQAGDFMRAFTDKGRMSALAASLPVQIITNPHCGLLGAAHYAARP